MGTRSLLGYEKNDNEIYYQYMQFDGGPEVKGREYYEGVVKAVIEAPGYFNGNGVETGCPNRKFFKRVRRFLDNYQYLSGHSFEEHSTCSLADWVALDCNQEWQYLFRRNGNFEFFQSGSDFLVTVPWALTENLMIVETSSWKDAPLLRGFWNEAQSLGATIEHATIASWGDKAPLHVNDEFEHESSKVFFKDMCKEGGKAPDIIIPSVALEYGKALCFPDQGREDGLMAVGSLKINGRTAASSVFRKRPTRCYRTERTMITKRNGSPLF